MKLRILLCALLSTFLLTGCITWPWKKPVEGGAAKPGTVLAVNNATARSNATGAMADTAQSNLDHAKQDTDSRTQDILSKTRANIIVARENNQGNVDGPPKQKTEQELAIADSRLQDIEPNKKELEDGKSRNSLIDQGRIQEARAATQTAIDQAKADAIALADAKRAVDVLAKERDEAVKARDAANLARDAAVKTYTDQAEKNKLDFDKRLDDERNRVRLEQARNLNWAAVISLALFGLGLGFGGLPGLQKTWPFGIIGILCFGLAQIVSQPWFMYACLAVVAIIVGLAIFWVVKHHQLGTLRQDAQQEAARFKEVLDSMVPILDEAYEKAEASGKELLDKSIFQPLSTLMNRDEKALVHSIRADVQLSKTPAGSSEQNRV